MYYEKRLINFNRDEVTAIIKSPRSGEIARFLIDNFPTVGKNDLIAGIFTNDSELQTIVIDNVGEDDFRQPGLFLRELDAELLWFGLIEMQFDVLVSLTIDDGVITSAEWLEDEERIDITEFIDADRVDG